MNIQMIFDGMEYELIENRYGVTVKAPEGVSEWHANADLELVGMLLIRRHVAGKRIVIETAV